MATEIGTLKIYSSFTLPADVQRARCKQVVVHSIPGMTLENAREYTESFRKANQCSDFPFTLVWTEVPRIEYL